MKMAKSPADLRDPLSSAERREAVRTRRGVFCHLQSDLLICYYSVVLVLNLLIFFQLILLIMPFSVYTMLRFGSV